MGWLFTSRTQSELIAKRTKLHETERFRIEVIAHTLCDDVLWSVVEMTDKNDLVPDQPTRYIRCDLLGKHEDQWGYKSLDESMHPYYYSCPLIYLDMAPEQSREWRKGVRAYHAQRKTSALAA
jgi:hypothetical protein